MYATAARVLGKSEGQVKAMVEGLGRGLVGPWRVEQKAAALAAWLVLATQGRLS